MISRADHRSGPDRGKGYLTKVMTMCSGVMQGIENCPKSVVLSNKIG